MKAKRQTETERTNIMTNELQRVQRDLAVQKRTGKKRSIQWISIDLETGRVSAPPNALRVVK